MFTRMDTKEKRLEYRAQALAAAKERGATVTEHPEADCVSIIYQRAERIARKKDEHGNRKLSGVAQTAAAIRKTLADHFPCVKFSVVSSTFSMGNDVTISWTDGPTTELVEHFTKRYQYGRFDAMQDLSYDVSIDPALNCPGAKYVSTSRTMSDDRRAEILAAATAAYGCEPPRDQYGEFNARRYENEHPELWREEYRRMNDEQRAERERAKAAAEAERAQKMQDEREAKIFRAKARENKQAEALAGLFDAVLGIERQPAEPAQVIDMTEYRQRRDGFSLAEFANKFCK